MLGSCFVENIGRKLEYFKFENFLNPLGILFHPAAIHKLLKRVHQKALFDEQDIFFHNEIWKCFEAHSDLNALQKEEVLSKLNSAVGETYTFLQNSTHVIVTPGTAWAYRNKASGEIVANCHKVSQKNFTKELTEVKNHLFDCVELIQNINPAVNIIFTISPVRHLKDGFVENQQSKAKLITAVHEVIAEKPGVDYFPAYEIMMDELRDYRFYNEDMMHPNQVAIDYIWNKFCEERISSEVMKIMKRVDNIQKGLSHRPFNEASEAHQKFKEDLQKKIQLLQQEYPKIGF